MSSTAIRPRDNYPYHKIITSEYAKNNYSCYLLRDTVIIYAKTEADLSSSNIRSMVQAINELLRATQLVGVSNDVSLPILRKMQIQYALKNMSRVKSLFLWRFEK